MKKKPWLFCEGTEATLNWVGHESSFDLNLLKLWATSLSFSPLVLQEFCDSLFNWIKYRWILQLCFWFDTVVRSLPPPLSLSLFLVMQVKSLMGSGEWPSPTQKSHRRPDYAIYANWFSRMMYLYLSHLNFTFASTEG